MPFVVPNLITRVLRGEYPDIQEVPHDPFHPWLEPEYKSLDEARRVISNLAWVLRRVYPGNPSDSSLIPISLGYHDHT